MDTNQKTEISRVDKNKQSRHMFLRRSTVLSQQYRIAESKMIEKDAIQTLFKREKVMAASVLDKADFRAKKISQKWSLHKDKVSLHLNVYTANNRASIHLK